MKLTLRNVLDVFGPEKQNPLVIKRKLLDYKQKGIVFFERDVCELSLDNEVDFHFCFMPSKKTEVNAFPVPTKLIEHHKNIASQFDYLKGFFESYYTAYEFCYDCFDTYDVYNPVVGSQFSWYYKKSS